MITATYHTDRADVINLQFSGLKDPLGATPSHPFWSVSRQSFIPAGELFLGEEVVALDGQTFRLTSITPRAGPEPVFNLEVANQHTYFVSRNGLLVHNARKALYLVKGKGEDGLLKYVGISKNVEMRRAQHELSGLLQNGDELIEVTAKLTHAQARTLEARIIRAVIDRAARQGKTSKLNDQVWYQLEQAGLRNVNRGRIESRWIKSDVFRHLEPDKVGKLLRGLEIPGF